MTTERQRIIGWFMTIGIGLVGLGGWVLSQEIAGAEGTVLGASAALIVVGGILVGVGIRVWTDKGAINNNGEEEQE